MKIHIGKYNDRKPRKVSVKIKAWDTYSMDETLALIIHPMLVQLTDYCSRHRGCAMVDDEDVPIHLRGEGQELYCPRWEYVLGEMVWAFGEHLSDKGEGIFFDAAGELDEVGLRAYAERKTTGFCLFGKYYQGLWT